MTLLQLNSMVPFKTRNYIIPGTSQPHLVLKENIVWDKISRNPGVR